MATGIRLLQPRLPLDAVGGSLHEPVPFYARGTVGFSRDA
jgi:hypothetical protein